MSNFALNSSIVVSFWGLSPQTPIGSAPGFPCSNFCILWGLSPQIPIGSSPDSPAQISGSGPGGSYVVLGLGIEQRPNMHAQLSPSTFRHRPFESCTNTVLRLAKLQSYSHQCKLFVLFLYNVVTQFLLKFTKRF